MHIPGCCINCPLSCSLPVTLVHFKAAYNLGCYAVCTGSYRFQTMHRHSIGTLRFQELLHEQRNELGACAPGTGYHALLAHVPVNYQRR